MKTTLLRARLNTWLHRSTIWKKRSSQKSLTLVKSCGNARKNFLTFHVWTKRSYGTSPVGPINWNYPLAMQRNISMTGQTLWSTGMIRTSSELKSRAGTCRRNHTSCGLGIMRQVSLAGIANVEQGPVWWEFVAISPVWSGIWRPGDIKSPFTLFEIGVDISTMLVLFRNP